MTTESTIIHEFACAAEKVLAHRFDYVDSLGDNTPIPIEALSDDHSIGIYSSVAPRKMRAQQATYTQVDIAEFSVQAQPMDGPMGASSESYLEYGPLRGVRFRVGDLQYLEQEWWATLPEVKYPTATVLTLLHLVMERYKRVFLYLNKTIPMPLWIRADPLGEGGTSVQCAIQARAGDRMRPTNIHTEVTTEYARRWADGARNFFEAAP